MVNFSTHSKNCLTLQNSLNIGDQWANYLSKKLGQISDENSPFKFKFFFNFWQDSPTESILFDQTLQSTFLLSWNLPEWWFSGWDIFLFLAKKLTTDLCVVKTSLFHNVVVVVGICNTAFWGFLIHNIFLGSYKLGSLFNLILRALWFVYVLYSTTHSRQHHR